MAGGINTLAGSGSVVTLALLSFLGLPSTIANGTNRIGVLFQSVTGFLTYNKNIEPDEKQDNNWGIIGVTVLGAIIGTQIAVEIDERLMNLSIGVLMIGLLGLVLMKPKKWLRSQKQTAKWGKAMAYFVFFLIGIYGGFIQAGVGVLLLSALILGEGMTMNQSNKFKILVVLIYTIPSLLLFLYNGQVNWLYGLLLAVGQIVGAWVAARFAVRYPNSNIYIRYLLIGILIFSIFRFFSLGLNA